MAGEIQATSIVSNSITAAHVRTPGANLPRTVMATNALQLFPVNLADVCKWDDLSLKLTNTPATTYLGLVTGTYGTNPPTLQTGDLKSAGSTTRRGRIILALPDRFPAAGSVSLRAIAGMKTTVADTTATVLVDAYQLLDDGTLSALLTSGTGVTCNSLTLANKDFTVTSSGLSPGDRLDVRVSIAVNDGAGVTAVIGLLQSLILRCDCLP